MYFPLASTFHSPSPARSRHAYSRALTWSSYYFPCTANVRDALTFLTRYFSLYLQIRHRPSQIDDLLIGSELPATTCTRWEPLFHLRNDTSAVFPRDGVNNFQESLNLCKETLRRSFRSLQRNGQPREAFSIVIGVNCRARPRLCMLIYENVSRN